MKLLRYNVIWIVLVFFFKQKTAYEMRISDWSSDVCSSDLISDERSDEKVSDIRLFGSRTSCSIAKPSCIFGMAPSDGRPSLRPTSSGVRITLNNCSRPRTNNAANNRTEIGRAHV